MKITIFYLKIAKTRNFYTFLGAGSLHMLKEMLPMNSPPKKPTGGSNLIKQVEKFNFSSEKAIFSYINPIKPPYP